MPLLPASRESAIAASFALTAVQLDKAPFVRAVQNRRRGIVREEHFEKQFGPRVDLLCATADHAGVAAEFELIALPWATTSIQLVKPSRTIRRRAQYQRQIRPGFSR